MKQNSTTPWEICEYCVILIHTAHSRKSYHGLKANQSCPRGEYTRYTCMSPSKVLSLTAFVISCPPKGEKKPCRNHFQIIQTAPWLHVASWFQAHKHLIDLAHYEWYLCTLPRFEGDVNVACAGPQSHGSTMWMEVSDQSFSTGMLCSCALPQNDDDLLMISEFQIPIYN